MWEDIGKACGWKHPRPHSVKWLWKEKATEASLYFLLDTRASFMITVGRTPKEGEVGVVTMRRMDRARPRMYFSLFFPLSLFPYLFIPFLCLGGYLEKEEGERY